MEDNKSRCGWCLGNGIYTKYHDREWGVPSFDDRRLFEFLLLEGAQAGLSWLTVLKKRDGYKAAFDGYDPWKISSYGEIKIAGLMQDAGLIRNRAKINAFVHNSRIYIRKFAVPGSFSEFIWSFTDGKPVINNFENICDIPTISKEAEEMSSALKTLGFCFVGPVSCYAYMQSIGMVNDHIVSCFRYSEVQSEGLLIN
jgi:DNA-3-methyladenine glycosylase I